MQAQEKAEQQAEEDSEPKIVMPSELQIPKKHKHDGSVHSLLQDSRISKEDEQIAVQTQESTATNLNEITEQTEIISTQGGQADAQQQRVVEAIQEQLKSLPIELNNAQIAEQLSHLTPEEAIQMAEEAQKQTTQESDKPADAVNLMIDQSQPDQNVTALSQQNSQEGVDVNELNKLEQIGQEAKNIESSFTEYIVPDHEKHMVDTIFEKNMEMAKVNNASTNETKQAVS